MRDLLYASLPAGVRGALHRQAADALLAAGAPASAAAAHLAAGARRGDRAAAATLRAAARELSTTDPARAAAHALDALRLLDVPEAGADATRRPADAANLDALRLEAVELLTRTGRDAEAAALVEQGARERAAARARGAPAAGAGARPRPCQRRDRPPPRSRPATARCS